MKSFIQYILFASVCLSPLVGHSFDERLNGYTKEIYPPKTLIIAPGNLVLLAGEGVYSKDYALVLLDDGNLVLSHKETNEIIWSTLTQNGEKAIFHKNGNFVLYDGSDQPIWESKSYTGGQMIIHANGELVIVGQHGLLLWSSVQSSGDNAVKNAQSNCNQALGDS